MGSLFFESDCSILDIYSLIVLKVFENKNIRREKTQVSASLNI